MVISAGTSSLSSLSLSVHQSYFIISGWENSFFRFSAFLNPRSLFASSSKFSKGIVGDKLSAMFCTFMIVAASLTALVRRELVGKLWTHYRSGLILGNIA
jgi:hypothetical protein